MHDEADLQLLDGGVVADRLLGSPVTRAEGVSIKDVSRPALSVAKCLH